MEGYKNKEMELDYTFVEYIDTRLKHNKNGKPGRPKLVNIDL